MIYHDFGALAGVKAGYDDASQKAHCDKTYSDAGLHGKCMANSNWVNLPPWTDVGRRQRGLPATGAVGKAMEKVSDKDVAKAGSAAKDAAMKKAGVDGGGGSSSGKHEDSPFTKPKGIGLGMGAALALGAALLFMRKR